MNPNVQVNFSTDKDYFKSTWRAPSNIAFTKYWGKKDFQIPQNPSLSMSLSNCFTETGIEFVKNNDNSSLLASFIFEGKEKPEFAARILKYLEYLLQYIPELNHYKLKISSKNSFPHSSGIASSASAFSALALAITDFEFRFLNKIKKEDLSKRASFLARLGSGSAARSVYGGFCLWGKLTETMGSNEYAEAIIKFHNNFNSLCDAILVVDKDEKEVSSSLGHQLMNESSYAAARFIEAKLNTKKLFDILEHGDKTKFFELIEKEALSLHGLMLLSTPPFILLKPPSLELIKKITRKREVDGLMIGYTIDAGPNIHLIYFKEDELDVKKFIEKECFRLYESVIYNEMSLGPTRLENE